MRTIQTTKKFRRDLKREKRGRFGKEIEHLLRDTLSLLATDKPLPHRYYDHELSGDWSDHRDCHVAPDLILIYRKPDIETLELIRLGSHSELGL